MLRAVVLLLVLLVGAACDRRSEQAAVWEKRQSDAERETARLLREREELESQLAAKQQELAELQRRIAETPAPQAGAQAAAPPALPNALAPPSPPPSVPGAPADPSPDDAPAIRGVVQAGDTKADVYVLSVGSKDGVKAGYEFAISRGDRYVSTIVIDSVFPNHSAGHVKPGMRKFDVEPGDVAETAKAVGMDPAPPKKR